MDFESKWYQQAAAITEKHKVSLRFKPCAAYCFLFCLLLFIVFVLFFVCFVGLFLFGLFLLVCFFLLAFCFFFNYVLVFNKRKHSAS